MRLLSDVRFSLAPPGNDIAGKKNSSGGAKEPVHVMGKSLDFARESRTMQLQGPVEAQTRAARLRAGKADAHTRRGVSRAENLSLRRGRTAVTPDWNLRMRMPRQT